MGAPEKVRLASFSCAGLCAWLHEVKVRANAQRGLELAGEAAAVLGEQEGWTAIEEEEGAAQPPAVEAGAPWSAALALLDKRDLTELKSLAKPPQPVMVVCVCLTLLLGEPGADCDGWAGAKKTLGDASLLKRLREFRMDAVQNEQ